MRRPGDGLEGCLEVAWRRVQRVGCAPPALPGLVVDRAVHIFEMHL